MGAPDMIVNGTAAGGPPIGGTGTTNTIPRWTGPSTLGDSGITDNGSTVSFVGRNITAPSTAGGASYVLAPTSGQVFGQTVGSSVWYLGRTTAAGAAVQSDICVNASGNVGIGTASPQEKTQVFGNLKVGVYASGSFISLGDEGTTQKNVGIFRGASVNELQLGGYGGIICTTGAAQLGSQTERMRISNAGTQAQSQVAIGTSSFTSGRALTTVADLDVFGVRVGRGGDGSQTSNTALGRSALGSITTGDSCTAVGSLALQSVTGSRNTAIGYAALGAIGASTDNTAVGASAIGNNTGSRNTAVGRNALNGSAGASTGSDNVCIGERAGDSITTGASNIVIGSNADVAAATDSNKLVIGDATNYVATNGGATTYYATAGALAGYIIVRLNGTDVKLPVYAL